MLTVVDVWRTSCWRDGKRVDELVERFIDVGSEEHANKFAAFLRRHSEKLYPNGPVDVLVYVVEHADVPYLTGEKRAWEEASDE